MASAALDGVASQQTDRFAVWLVLNNETRVWLRCTCVSFLMLRCGIAPDFLLFGGSYRDIFRAVPHRHRAFDGRLRRVDLQGPFHAEDRQKVYALHRPLFRRLPGADAADGLPSRQPVFRVYRALRPLDRLRPARADRL